MYFLFPGFNDYINDDLGAKLVKLPTTFQEAIFRQQATEHNPSENRHRGFPKTRVVELKNSKKNKN